MASTEDRGVEAGGGTDERKEEEEEEESSSLSVANADAMAHSSPQLSRRALDELGQLQGVDKPEDPDNYPLHSPWAFWFER